MAVGCVGIRYCLDAIWLSDISLAVRHIASQRGKQQDLSAVRQSFYAGDVFPQQLPTLIINKG